MLAQMTQSVCPVSRMSSSKQDVPAAQIGQQFGLDAQRSRRGRRAAIARRLQESDAQRQIEMAHEIGEEHQTAGQHADNGNGSTAIVGGDLPGHFGDSSLDVVGRQQDFHAALSGREHEGS